jgi:hypothetical protein
MCALCFYPYSYETEGYYVKLHNESHFNKIGFLLVSNSQDGPWGSVCSSFEKGGSTLIAQVACTQLSKQLGFGQHNSAIGGLRLNSDKYFVKKPLLSKAFLKPYCEGNETTLKECHHYGLGVGLNSLCYDHYELLVICDAPKPHTKTFNGWTYSLHPTPTSLYSIKRTLLKLKFFEGEFHDQGRLNG